MGVFSKWRERQRAGGKRVGVLPTLSLKGLQSTWVVSNHRFVSRGAVCRIGLQDSNVSTFLPPAAETSTLRVRGQFALGWPRFHSERTGFLKRRFALRVDAVQCREYHPAPIPASR
jgi:hypothetical protein